LPQPADVVERALVLGATGELGEAVCRSLSAAGTRVVAAGRRADRLQSLEAAGLVAEHFMADLAQPQAILDALESQHFDLLVLCTGATEFGPFCERPWDSIEREMSADPVGAAHVLHAAARAMVRRGSGRIIVIGSTAQYRPAPRLAVYAAGKAFLTSMAQSLALELRGTGVSITCCIAGPFGSTFANGARIPRKAGAGTAKRVAAAALAGSANGRAVVYAGLGARMRAMAYSGTPNWLLSRMIPPGKRPS
jgi:hypothetical protein